MPASPRVARTIGGMVSFTGKKDFEAQPKRNRAATAIHARTAGTATIEPSIHLNGGLGLKRAAVATLCFAACLNTIGRSEIKVVLRRVVTQSKTDFSSFLIQRTIPFKHPSKGEECSICALLFTSASYLSLLSSFDSEPEIAAVSIKELSRKETRPATTSGRSALCRSRPSPKR